MGKDKINGYFKKNLKDYVKDYPFFCIRLDSKLIIVKPKNYHVCFFVDNSGIEVPNPKTNKIYPRNFSAWEEAVKEKNQFASSTHLDKFFLHNVIRAIWRITDGLSVSLSFVKTA